MCFAHEQCDQIGRCLKVAKIFPDFLGDFEILYFQAKNAVATFWATFGSILFQHLVLLHYEFNMHFEQPQALL